MSDDEGNLEQFSGRNRPKSFLSGSQQAILLGDVHKYSSDPDLITRVSTIEKQRKVEKIYEEEVGS